MSEEIADATPPAEDPASYKPLYFLVLCPSGEIPFVKEFYSQAELDAELAAWNKEEVRVLLFRGGEPGRVVGDEKPISDFTAEPSESPFLNGYLGELETLELNDSILLDPPRTLPNRRPKPTPDLDEEDPPATVRNKPSVSDDW